MTGIPTRKLGNTGRDVTILGLGGEGVLRTYDREDDAVPLIRRAIELGVTYCDCAKAYANSELYYGAAFQGNKLREKVFLCSKSADRTRKGAERDLEATLRRMGTDRLDLWQVHDVRTDGDLREIFGPQGAIEAFRAAKAAGKVRHVGLTGHHDPAILVKAMQLFPFENVLLPVNAAEPHHRSFLDEVVPLARSKGMGVVGMKVLRGFVAEGRGRGPELSPRLVERGITISRLLRFAWSQPISCAVIGCETIEELEENVAIAKSGAPLGEAEAAALVKASAPLEARITSYKQGVSR